MRFLGYLSSITLSFLFYVEYSVGHVFYRVNSLGYKSFHLSSIFYYLIEPLRNKFLWNYQLLDVNYIFILINSIIIYFLILYNGENKPP
jgi:hypothetical protein